MIPALHYLCNDDFTAALNAANVNSLPTKEQMNKARARVDAAVIKMLAGLQMPSAADNNRLVGFLKEVTEQVKALQDKLTSSLPIKWLCDSSQPDGKMLAEFLAASGKLEIYALIGCIEPSELYPTAEAELASVITTLHQAEACLHKLRIWAESSAETLVDCWEATEGHEDLKYPEIGYADRALPYTGVRRRPRALGQELIWSYADLSDNEVGFSRGTTGNTEGKVTGPLIRYLDTLFDRIRKAVAANDEIKELADSDAFKPSHETMARWVKRWRANRASVKDSDYGGSQY